MWFSKDNSQDKLKSATLQPKLHAIKKIFEEKRHIQNLNLMLKWRWKISGSLCDGQSATGTLRLNSQPPSLFLSSYNHTIQYNPIIQSSSPLSFLLLLLLLLLLMLLPPSLFLSSSQSSSPLLFLVEKSPKLYPFFVAVGFPKEVNWCQLWRDHHPPLIWIN